MQMFAEGAIGGGSGLRGDGEVRGGPRLDAEGRRELRKAQPGLCSCKRCQREPGGGPALSHPLALCDSEFPSRFFEDLLESGTEKEALSPRDLRAAGSGADHLLDLLAEAFSAEIDLSGNPFPGSVPRPLCFGNKLPVSGTRLPLAFKLAQCPVGVEPVGGSPKAGRRTIVAPAPLPGRPNVASSHWVENDIPGQLEQVGLLLYKHRFEPSLHQVADSSATPIEPLRIHAIDLPHTAGKIRLRCLDEQVKVVAHQDECVQTPLHGPDDVPEYFEEPLSVAIVPEDVTPFVAPTGHVPDSARVFQPQRPRHDERSHYHRPDPRFWDGKIISPESASTQVSNTEVLGVNKHIDIDDVVADTGAAATQVREIGMRYVPPPLTCGDANFVGPCAR